MKYVETDINQKGLNVFLFFTAIIIQIPSFVIGMFFCWTTPVAPKLQYLDDNPLGFPLTVDEVSWLSSLVSLGATAGPFAGGYLSDLIGRKKTLIWTMVLALLSFAILAFGKDLYLLYVARVMGGICVGVVLAVVPIYVGEIAEIHNRGTLGGLTGLFVVSGNFYCFAAGPYLSVLVFTLSCMIFPVIFLILCILFVPESPCFLIMKSKHDQAKGALKKLRRGDIETELQDLTASVKESLTNKGGISDIFRTRSLLNGLIVTAGLMVIQQCTAITALVLYMQGIFESAASSVSKEIATIIVGIAQIIAMFVSSAVVDKLGRRPLVLISTIFTSISLLVLSLYFYLLITIDVSSLSWLPLIALIIHFLLYNVGIGPIPVTVLGEIFPPHVKSAASSLTVGCCFLLSFTAAKIFPLLGSMVENWFSFFVFGMLNALGIIFIWYRMPETKGKTLMEILESLK